MDMDQVHYSPQTVTDEILPSIKYSNLHFNIQGTPHSVYITVRKKFVREASISPSSSTVFRQELITLEDANNSPKYDLAGGEA